MPRKRSISQSAIDISSLGDSALIVRLSGDTAHMVPAAAHQIEKANIVGVTEVTRGYAAVAIFFDPVKIKESGVASDRIIEWLGEKICDLFSHPRRLLRAKLSSRLIDIPICFDPEFALDLEQIAEHAQLPIKQVVDLYCAADYRVAFLGFTPGFPYLLGLPQQLATPRRASPRKEIAAGSIAIGGDQTGIYPLSSPGGWNVLGRTPLRLFQPQDEPPALVLPNDRIRFHPISRDEFDRSTLCI